MQGGGDSERARVRWLAREILPHEQDVRIWLKRSLVTSNDVDDVVQEAYCRLANLKAVEQIESPRAYFFQTARSVVLEQMRRARIVRIDAVIGHQTGQCRAVFEKICFLDAVGLSRFASDQIGDEAAHSRIDKGKQPRRRRVQRVVEIENPVADMRKLGKHRFKPLGTALAWGK